MRIMHVDMHPFAVRGTYRMSACEVSLYGPIDGGSYRQEEGGPSIVARFSGLVNNLLQGVRNMLPCDVSLCVSSSTPVSLSIFLRFSPTPFCRGGRTKVRAQRGARL